MTTAQPVAFTAEHVQITSEIAEHLGSLLERARLRKQMLSRIAELEEQVAERSAAFQEVNAHLTSSVYSVAHDLRPSLRALQGFARILQQENTQPLGSQGAEYIQRIVNAAKYLYKMILDLLAYNRVGREQIVLRPVDNNHTLMQAINQVQGEIQERGAHVAVADPLPTVLARSPTLVKALVHLMSNGAKFRAPGNQPWLSVGAERHGHRVRLFVLDNGIGIAPEYRERIFGVFQRLHGLEEYPGTGIGLATVYKAMERMNGRCRVESEVSQGSRFWLELPMACGER